MFIDVFEAMDAGREPMETLYDGYIVNAILDACYKSAETKQWEPIEIDDWRGKEIADTDKVGDTFVDEQYDLIKKEKMPDGREKLILKDKKSGEVIEKIQ